MGGMAQDALPRAHVVLAPIIGDPSSDNSSDENSQSSDSTLDTAVPISRKERRKQRRAEHTVDTRTSESESSTAISTSPKPSSATAPRKKRPSSHPTTSLTSAPQIPPKMPPPAKLYPLLVCSLGNPGSQYARTLHSAGHTMLQELQRKAPTKMLPFASGYGGGGKISRPDLRPSYLNPFRSGERQLHDEEDDFTLYMSGSLMNVSGKGIAQAWKMFKSQRGEDARLVVVHDELEAPLGKVSVKTGEQSAKGHNGLKSCQASLRGFKWWRIGVGIGRPESRESADVSKYVLRKMTDKEEKAVQGALGDVFERLREIRRGDIN